MPDRDESPSPLAVSPGCFASRGETEVLAEIQLRGVDGKHGQDGISFPRALRGNGRSGNPGGDATPGHPGTDADDAAFGVAYSDAGSRDRICVHGGAVVEETIGDEGYVFFEARGGRGGNGGRGGDGQPGSRGAKGRNATRYSNGGNGGPGGDGGRAGNPTDGRHGGEGGDIRLRLSHLDQGLLMLVKGDQRGGDVGFAGEPGKPGKGGAGGPGGSSYHWTETRTTRDSKGNTRTHTVFRSNPGGSKGRRGRDGAPSFYRAKDGLRGDDGRFEIQVIQPNGGVRRFPSPYDLQLVSFDVASETKILEPDSLVSLDAITVINRGGMPTPPNYVVRVTLPIDQWIESDEIDLILPCSIAPGERHTFRSDGLGFRIGDYVVGQPRRRPFTLDLFLSPTCRMESGIRRPFRNFENAEEVEVRFPVELTDIEALNSLSPGESSRVRLGLTNVGDETFDDKYLHRAVRLGARLTDGDLNPGHVVFFDDQDQLLDLTTLDFRKSIRGLKPGETRRIETRIGIRDHKNITAYQSFSLSFDLHLQRPGSSSSRDQFRCVDDRRERFRVSEQYRRDEGSRFLLIANQKTDVNDIEKWTQLADYFGSDLDVWDVSYYGFFDLVRQVDEDESLLQQWSGMTIIIPNDYYQTPSGKTVAFTELAKSQFLQAAANHDINFYVVGDSRTGGKKMLESALIPLGSKKSSRQLASQRDFLKQVKRWNKYVTRSGDVGALAAKDASEFADASLGAVHQFDINQRTWLFQPDAKWLEKHAQRFQRKLQKMDPLHRWVIVHRYDTGDTDTEWGFFKKRQIGHLEARRSLDSSKGSAVVFEVDPIDLVSENFITSRANKHGIFLALKFEDKVDRFIRVVSERVFPRYREDYVDRPLTDNEVTEIGNELLDSILLDIYNEQLVARESRMWGLGGVGALTPKLNYLADRSMNYAVTYRQMVDNAATLTLLYELVANIRYIAGRSKTIWDYPIFPTALFKRSRAVSKHMMNRADRITANIFGRKMSWWDKWTSASDDYDPFGGAKKAIPKGLARDTADERIMAIESDLWKSKAKLTRYTVAQSYPGLTYDPEVLPTQDRVMSGKVFDELVRKEKQADQRRAKTEYEVAHQRSELLVPLQKRSVVVQSSTTVTKQAT